MKKGLQLFDRNSFKEFISNSAYKRKSNCPFHRKFKSFGVISDEYLKDNFRKTGTLKDKNISKPDHIYYADSLVDWNNEKAFIATNFAPYRFCDIYECNTCKSLCMVYKEPSAGGYTLKIREINPKLIVENPKMYVFTIEKENLNPFISDLELSVEEFLDQIKNHKNLQIYDPEYQKANKVFIKVIDEQDDKFEFLIISSHEKHTFLIEKYS